MALRSCILISLVKDCLRCGKSFSKPQNESMNAWNNRRKYCSKACKHGPIFEKKCQQCGNNFVVRAYRKDTAHFCSKKCAYIFRDEGKRTANKVIRQSTEYKKWRLSVFERDNYTCVECGDHNYEGRGKTVELHADHIKPFALFPDLRFDINNGRTLCKPCHLNTGTYGRGSIYRTPAVA